MAIQLYFSNRLERLAEKLTESVYADSGNTDIFRQPVIIVPNANLVKWLQLFFAKKRSVAMNIAFRYLEDGMRKLIEALDPGKEKPEPLDRKLSQIILLYILQHPEGDMSALFHQYLRKDRPGYAGRVSQLSDRLATLFQEYEFNRPEMIRDWLAGKSGTQEMEICQQKLYLRLNELTQKLSRNSRPFFSLRAYAERISAKMKAGSAAAKMKFLHSSCGEPVHLFSFSHISVFYLDIIRMLGAYYDISVYALNPCYELWEDIRTPGEKKWTERKKITSLAVTRAEEEQGELYPNLYDNELLSLWGKAGRDGLRFLCALTDYDVNPLFVEEETDTVLKQIQNDILTLSPEDISGTMPQDCSLQIMACPGIYREVETVYNSILYNLEEKDQLTDIAILVQDISAYKPVFDAVFSRKPPGIVFNLVDTHAEIESIYGHAVLKILNLASGRFSRKEVFDLMLNPCFAAKWKTDADEVAVWAKWSESLNIFHSFDKKSKKERKYKESPSYTWKQGLQRLRMSRILAPDPQDPFRHFQGVIPFGDEHTGDTGLAGKFCEIIQTLYRSVSELRRGCPSASEWKDRFLKSCDGLLEIPEGLKGEQNVRKELIRALDRLAFYDCLGEDSGKSGPDPEMIKEFIKSELKAISGGYGDYLTGGVTISALLPMRPVPFKIIYMLGMEEGAFPGKTESSSLDLRLVRRRIGDLSLPERNRYLFLEMLLSAREKLYISFVSKDLQKDRVMQPCSVVSQLRRYAEQHILPPGESFQITEIPLKGSSQRYYRDTVKPYSDVMVNFSPGDRIASFRENRLWDQVKEKALPSDLKRVRRFMPETAAAALPRTAAPQSETVTLRQLKQFLEDPVKHGSRRHLGLYDGDDAVEEITLEEDEPFFSEFPADWELKIRPLRRWLDAYFSGEQQDIVKLYNQIYDRFLLESRTPDGDFALSDRKEIEKDVMIRFRTLEPLADQMKSGSQCLYRSVFIGSQSNEAIPSSNRLPVEQFDPLELRVRAMNDRGENAPMQAAVHGQLPWIWKNGGNGWNAMILTGSAKSPNKQPDKYILEPMLFYLSCLSTDAGRKWLGDSPISFHIVYKEKIGIWQYNIAEAEAKQYMEKLVSDYLNQTSWEWLPFDTVMNIIKTHEFKEKAVSRETFRSELESEMAKDRSYPVRLLRPALSDNALDNAADRFQIFLKKRNEK